MKEAGLESVLIGPVAGKQYTGKNGYPLSSEVAIDWIHAKVALTILLTRSFAGHIFSYCFASINPNEFLNPTEEALIHYCILLPAILYGTIK